MPSNASAPTAASTVTSALDGPAGAAGGGAEWDGGGGRTGGVTDYCGARAAVGNWVPTSDGAGLVALVSSSEETGTSGGTGSGAEVFDRLTRCPADGVFLRLTRGLGPSSHSGIVSPHRCAGFAHAATEASRSASVIASWYLAATARYFSTNWHAKR